MSFLSQDALKKVLKSGFLCDENNNPIDDESYIYENSFALTIGAEAFTTTDPECKNRSLVDLKKKKVFHIEGGQFALLITEEIISIPKGMMGFINLNTIYKFKGLINVSGFHVNPEWKGQLVFTVYNAGPHSIPIRIKEKAFRVWLSRVEDFKDDVFIDRSLPIAQTTIDTEKIYSLDGDIYSPHLLAKRLQDFKSLTYNKWSFGILSLMFGIVIGLVSNAFIIMSQHYSGDNRIYLRTQLKAEIKEEIVNNELEIIKDFIEKLEKHSYDDKKGE